MSTRKIEATRLGVNAEEMAGLRMPGGSGLPAWAWTAAEEPLP